MAGCPRVQGVLAAILVRPAVMRTWPEEVVSYCNHMLPSHAAVGLGKCLFPLFARSLDLSPDFFDDKVRICPLPYC